MVNVFLQGLSKITKLFIEWCVTLLVSLIRETNNVTIVFSRTISSKMLHIFNKIV